MVSFQNLDVWNCALRKEQPLYLRSVFIIWPLLSWDLLWLASLSGTACCGMADTVGWGCKYGIDRGREGFISSSSESLELFSLLDEEDEELLESDELSELLSWSMILASAFSSANNMICFSVFIHHNWNIKKRENKKSTDMRHTLQQLKKTPDQTHQSSPEQRKGHKWVSSLSCGFLFSQLEHFLPFKPSVRTRVTVNTNT